MVKVTFWRLVLIELEDLILTFLFSYQTCIETITELTMVKVTFWRLVLILIELEDLILPFVFSFF